jgi:hypothetical protein
MIGLGTLESNADQNVYQESEERETHTKVYAVNLR